MDVDTEFKKVLKNHDAKLASRARIRKAQTPSEELRLKRKERKRLKRLKHVPWTVTD